MSCLSDERFLITNASIFKMIHAHYENKLFGNISKIHVIIIIIMQ